MKKITLVFVLFLASFSVRGQDSLSVIWLSVPDTVTFNQVDTVAALIQNSGSTTISFDSLYLWAMVNNFMIPFPVDTQLVTQFSPGDTITLWEPNFVFSGLYFQPGNNIVVVWPMTGNQGTGVDSAMGVVYVKSGPGVGESPSDMAFCFPSLLAPGAYLSCSAVVAELRLLDLSGRIFILDSENRKIPDDIPPGMYVLEWNEKGRTRTQKVLIR